MYQSVLKLTTPLQQFNRSYHCYRPIKYCDWHKPPNEFYYELICPICPEAKCKPQITCEKQCTLCSFWEQLKDNCCGFSWPIPPMPMRSDARVYVCKDLRRKPLRNDEAKERLDRSTFPLHDCYDTPDCPEPNWEALRPPGISK